MADGIVNDGSVDLEFCTCISFYFCTEAAQEFCQYGDVGQIRGASDNGFAGRQDGSSHYGQGGVLGAADVDGTGEPDRAFNVK